jgi:hypothetical protein
MNLPPFRTGNVIKDLDGSLWIVTRCDDKTVQAVAFSSENVYATQYLEDTTREVACGCTNDWQRDADSVCADCNGDGRVTRKTRGWKHCTYIAGSVQQLIMTRLLKVFTS